MHLYLKLNKVTRFVICQKNKLIITGTKYKFKIVLNRPGHATVCEMFTLKLQENVMPRYGLKGVRGKV
jgi:hypothetical protein